MARSARSPNIWPRSKAHGAASRPRSAARSNRAARGSISTSIFPADESKWDKAKTDTWTWDTYLTSAQKLHAAGFPVGLPMGQTSDAVDWVGALFNSYGVVMVDAKDNIKVNSDE